MVNILIIVHYNQIIIIYLYFNVGIIYECMKQWKRIIKNINLKKIAFFEV